MGRLPDTFAGKKIYYRQPYEVAGDIGVTTGLLNQLFPDATFQNATDKPFEIHRVIPYVVALDAGGLPILAQPDQGLLQALIRLYITDLAKDAPLTKVPTLVSSLVKGSSERTWEWAEPYYLAKSEQFQVTINTQAFPAGFAGAGITSLRVYITFEGFFVVITPPQGGGR
jgi:hypothetical protein